LQINIAYVAVSSFYSIIWAEPFREEEVLDMNEMPLRKLKVFYCLRVYPEMIPGIFQKIDALVSANSSVPLCSLLEFLNLKTLVYAIFCFLKID